MKKLVLFITIFFALLMFTLQAEANVDIQLKYKSNYLMPAYVNFKMQDNQYIINAKINIPLYKIRFQSSGEKQSDQFLMKNYQDLRNGKLYAKAEIRGNKIEYGKVKSGVKLEKSDLPVFDLFSIAFQLSYFDKLPQNFQITNGKKLYPMKNVRLQKTQKTITENNRTFAEISYQFHMGEKSFVVKKYAGERFPRFISYDKDGDYYQLQFSEFVR